MNIARIWNGFARFQPLFSYELRLPTGQSTTDNIQHPSVRRITEEHVSDRFGNRKTRTAFQPEELANRVDF
jgi:hypothetical protein